MHILICEYLQNLFCEKFAKDMGGLDDFWMDNATQRAEFFIAKKDRFIFFNFLLLLRSLIY